MSGPPMFPPYGYGQVSEMFQVYTIQAMICFCDTDHQPNNLANNEVPGDVSLVDEFVIILNPQPPVRALRAALPPVVAPPQSLGVIGPQNGPVANDHVVNGHPQVGQPVENGPLHAGVPLGPAAANGPYLDLNELPQLHSDWK